MTDPSLSGTLYTASGVTAALAMERDVANPRALGSPRGRMLLTIVLVGTITLVVSIMAVGTWPVGIFQDDGIYTVLAKALASGQGYRYINIPGAPHATHYPPGYPAYLALLWKVSPGFPANVALFTFTNAVFLALAAVGAHYFGRKRLGLGNASAALVSLATVACVPTLIFGVFVLSEPMFMALLLPTLLLAERAADTGRPRDAALAGFAAGALAMVRTMGQFVIPALLLVLVARRRWRAAALSLAGGAIFLLPWQLWVSAHATEVPPVLVGKYGPYSQWLTGALRNGGVDLVVRVAAKNVRALEGMAWAMFAGRDPSGTPPSQAIRAVIILSLLGLFALGAARVARRIPVTLAFLGAYMAMVVIWPFEPTRFVWVLLPITGLIVALGVTALVAWRPPRLWLRAARMGALVTAAFLAVGYAAYNVRGVAERWWAAVPDQNTARATPLVVWARAATHEGELLATDDDALLHLYTGRQTVPVGSFTPQEYLKAQTYEFAAQQLVRIIDLYHPRYVLCSTSYGVMAARPLLNGASPRLRVVKVLSRGVVFERVSE
jgi:hypothetical protein